MPSLYVCIYIFSIYFHPAFACLRIIWLLDCAYIFWLLFFLSFPWMYDYVYGKKKKYFFGFNRLSWLNIIWMYMCTMLFVPSIFHIDGWKFCASLTTWSFFFLFFLTCFVCLQKVLLMNILKEFSFTSTRYLLWIHLFASPVQLEIDFYSLINIFFLPLQTCLLSLF